MKTQLIVSVDVEVKLEATRDRIDNVSKVVNELLIDYLSIKKEGEKSKAELEGDKAKATAMMVHAENELKEMEKKEKKEKSRWRTPEEPKLTSRSCWY